MAQKMSARNHAIYQPRPTPRPAARSYRRQHAVPGVIAGGLSQPTVRLLPERRSHAAPAPLSNGAARSTTVLNAPVDLLSVGTLLTCLCILGYLLVDLVGNLYNLLNQSLDPRLVARIFPLLLGGIYLILVRQQLRPSYYTHLRQSTGLSGKRPTDSLLLVCYLLIGALATAVAATALAWGAVLLLIGLVG